MATEPRYTFDPVTQTYKLVDPMAPVTQPVRGLGPLYDAGGGSGEPATTSPGIGQGISPTAQAIGIGLSSYGQALGGALPGATMANMAGQGIMGQQANAMANAQANIEAMDQGPGRSMGIATVSDPVGNTFSVSNPSTIAAANMETFGVPDATVGLASMNAQQAAQNQVAAQQAQVANTAEAVGVAVSEEADAAQDAANAADAAAASGSGSGNGDAGGTAGVGDEGGHSADGNNSGGGGGGGGDPDGNGTGPGGGWYKGGSVMRYADGGLASARKTENMGRGKDTMLVHMTPNEVRGLQAIAMAHGGSLTINPKTGLVEAGFLDAILPTIAGVALSAAFPAAAPWMIGLGVGGGTALMTGSLEKGLMAGLGAFGGAGIGSALTAPAVTGTQAGLSQAAAQGLGVQGAATGAGSQASMLAAENAALGFTPAESMAQVANSANYAANAAIPANVLAPTAAQSAAINAQANLGGMQQGVSNLIQGTPGAREGFMQAAGGPMGLASKAGAALTPMFSAEEPDEPGKKPQEYIRPYSYDMKPSAETDPEFKYRTGKPGESTAEQRYFSPTFTPMGVFKAGTEPGGSFYGTPTEDQLKLYSGPKTSGLALANGGIANFDDQPGYDGMAKGGLKDGAFVVPADVVSHLGNGSNDAGQKLLARGLGARPIKGKGDGMSDSIPTTIEGKQPARVADGEAYIPPEVVKKVGAKRLYSMMDKIRHARTGTKRQAPEVDPRKFLPA